MTNSEKLTIHAPEHTGRAYIDLKIARYWGRWRARYHSAKHSGKRAKLREYRTGRS